MNRQDEQKDQRMKWLCTAAPKAAQPLVCAWHQLAELEFSIQQEQDPTKDIEDVLVPLSPEGDNINLSSVIRDLKLGLKCLGLINMQCVQKRHLDLQYKLAGAAKELAEPNQPFDDNLFSPNFDKHLTKILQANKLTYKLTSPQKKRGGHFNPFLGRGRGCNQRGGSRGYQNQNQNRDQNGYQDQWKSDNQSQSTS